jgi:NAD(P)-dependent dehydrogenase (short-subunit alcohol dehydrogenase family)
VSATIDLTGKTAIVTGASRGIGLAIAEGLIEAGANVVLTSRHQDAADAAAEPLGERALGIAAHAVDGDAAKACIDRTLQRFGAIDILVNNAGTNPAYGPLVDMDQVRFTKTMDLNAWAPVLWSGLVWHAWMKEHGGAIVNTASIGAYGIGPSMGVYHGSKAAIVHLTRHQAVEMGPGVRVNGVAPGLVRTKMAEALWKDHEESVANRTPLGRVGEPEDIAPAVVFLCSDGARWITGETITIDGGQIHARSSPS